MSWRRSLGFCLLVLTAAGCGAAGRASLPVESAPGAPAAGAADAMTQGPAVTLAAPGRTVLTGIRLVRERAPAGGVRVEIEASSPVNYTSYEPDPGKFILEIPNVDLSALPAELPIGEAGVERVVIAALPSHHGGTHARMEFLGQPAVKARVVPDGARLAVILEPSETTAVPAGLAAEESLTVPVAPASETVGAQAPALLLAPATLEAGREPRSVEIARTVSGVIVEGTGPAASVAIIGDGVFRHNAFTLKNPDRLVVDITGVLNKVPEKSFDVAAVPLQRVRVAQFRTQPQRVVRVVFDLSQATEHRVVSDADGLRVVFGDAALAADAAPAPAVMTAKMIAPAPAASMGRTPAFAVPEERAGAEPPPVAVAVPAQPAFAAPDPPAAAMKEPQPAPAAAKQETVPALPELAPRLVPSTAADLGKDIVLFDRADPGQETKSEASGMAASGLTFQSQTIAGEKRRYRGEKISVTFRDADIREVFFFFSDVMKMNIVLDPDVTGRIDIRLTQVPWDQAFQVILKNQGLDAVEEENVVRIARTQKLRQEAAERRALKQAQEQEVDPITFTRQLSYAKVSEALQILNQVKSDRGKLIADIRTNTLVISDIPDRRAAYENLLTALDTQTPQVSIEARVVEAIRSFTRSLGIDWNFTGLATPALGTQTNLQFPHRAEFEADVNLSSPSAAGTLGIALGNVLDSVTLDVQLDAFEADGKVRILSAPRIVTQNNQQARIEQGVQIPVVTTTATEIDVQYIPASLTLTVTPQITAEQTVIMQIIVENNQPSATVSVGDTPGIVTERVQTQVLVRSGTTAVIGGVYKLQETDNETGLPGLRRIPFFGWLFKNKSFEKNSSELLVFLTPKIVTNV